MLIKWWKSMQKLTRKLINKNNVSLSQYLHFSDNKVCISLVTYVNPCEEVIFKRQQSYLFFVFLSFFVSTFICWLHLSETLNHLNFITLNLSYSLLFMHNQNSRVLCVTNPISGYSIHTKFLKKSKIFGYPNICLYFS